MNLAMSAKERDRMAAIRAVDAGQISQKQAAVQLDLSPRRVRRIEAACDALPEAEASGENGRRLRKRYRKHRDSLFTGAHFARSLHREDVPGDNNASKRALRKPMVHRKVTGGFRSNWGAEAVVEGPESVRCRLAPRDAGPVVPSFVVRPRDNGTANGRAGIGPLTDDVSGPSPAPPQRRPFTHPPTPDSTTHTGR